MFWSSWAERNNIQLYCHNLLLDVTEFHSPKGAESGNSFPLLPHAMPCHPMLALNFLSSSLCQIAPSLESRWNVEPFSNPTFDRIFLLAPCSLTLSTSRLSALGVRSATFAPCRLAIEADRAKRSGTPGKKVERRLVFAYASAGKKG